MAGVPQGNFAEWLANRCGGHTHLIDAATGLAIKPAEIPNLIAGFGRSLQETGFEPGDVILVAGSTPLSCVCYLGAMFAGLVVALVEERALLADGAKLVAATGAKAIWTEQPANFKWLGQVKAAALDGNLTRGAPRPMAAVARAASDLAALMATSGSTGVPRFVRVTHGNLLANTEAIMRSQHLQSDERAMLVLPLSYCFGASVLHSHLAQGGGVVFDRRFMFPNQVLQAIKQYECTTFAGVPTAYHVLLQRSAIRTAELGSLRRMLQAGGALAWTAIQEMRKVVPHAGFYVMYGQTEATARITCLDPQRLDDKAGTVGRALDNLEIQIRDEPGQSLPVGQVGEIWVKGPSICAGYLNDGEETARVFQNGWLRTRDLGSLDQAGFLRVQGREGAFVKMRGMRVSLAEVESRVAAIPGVQECAAHPAKHAEAGEALVLMVVRKAGMELKAEEVRRGLPAHWALDSVRFVPELPKTANGKLSRAALAEQLRDAGGNN